MFDLCIEELNMHKNMGLLLPMVYKHNEEIFKGTGNPDIVSLTALVNAGALRCYVASSEGRFIGYCVFALARDIFFAHKVKAECLAIYMEKEFRSYATKRMMKIAEVNLASEGVNTIVSSTNANSSLRKWYERQGYKVMNEHVYKEI